ncbi:hypothetical protein IFR05_001435 [Cadophora sp. M221]|nr:hypothetical protein IFR05_001435 [Cadophora sp. M221]
MWSEFNLEVLTIVFYATSAIDGASHGDFYEDDISISDPKTFRKPAINCRMGRRATWICQYATKALHGLKEEKLQEWNVPRIESICRVGGGLEQNYVEKDFNDDEVQVKNVNGNHQDSSEDSNLANSTINDGGSADYNKGPNGGHHLVIDDDSFWYEKAAAAMVHLEPTMEVIKSLKQKYHPK